MFSREKFISDYYLTNIKKKLFFFKIYRYFFSSIAKTLSLMISQSKNFLFIGIGQFPFIELIKSDKITVNEIGEPYLEEFKKINKDSNIKNFDKDSIYDNILISSLEYEKDPLLFLDKIRNLIQEDGRVFILKYNLWWVPFIKIFSFFKLRVKHPYQNIISDDFLKNMCLQSNFEIVEKKSQILFPFYIPVISFLINDILAKLPIFNFFCFINIFVLRPIQKSKNLDTYNVTIIVPCKNEEGNIKRIVDTVPAIGKKTQILFGDDKSTDNTLEEIKKYKSSSEKISIDYYEAPGVCKSENVYMGFDKAEGDLIAILDADNTVRAEELKDFFGLLATNRYDFINGTRFIYPMSSNAMKKINFIGNILFSYLFKIFLGINITDTLCGTKVFFKRDWKKIKRYNGSWGLKDKWGDYDLLLGAKKNFLKIGEKPVFYEDRISGETKMTNVFSNAFRMMIIIIYSFFKIKK